MSGNANQGSAWSWSARLFSDQSTKSLNGPRNT